MTKIKMLSVIVFLITAITGYSKPTTIFSKSQQITQWDNPTSVLFAKNFGQGDITAKIYSYKIKIKVSIKESKINQYKLNDRNLASVNVDVQIYNEQGNEYSTLSRVGNESFPLYLNADKTSETIIIDLADKIGFNIASRIPLSKMDIEPRSFQSSDLDVTVEQVIEYGVLPYKRKIKTTNAVINNTNREVTLKWDNEGITYGAYEIQIMKLSRTFDVGEQHFYWGNCTYNYSEGKWSRASSIIVEGNCNELTTKVIEGSGYYVWRIRPIGGYNSGMYNSTQNYGRWSRGEDKDQYISMMFAMAVGNIPDYFEFIDPNDSKNWSYSKTYTETSAKEGITFADQLLQPRQSQVYIPSDGTTVVTQSIKDFAGRPTLVTLPAPIDGNFTSRYIKDFATNSNGTNYKAEDFDSEDTRTAPNQLHLKGDYYSDTYSDKDVPDAQGYPFTRILYKDDGSGEIDKESGPGLYHKIGSGHETIHEIQEVGENELIALFGAEAPNFKKVLKKLVTSPDGITTVTYVTLDGNVIATSIMIKEGQTVPFADLDDYANLLDEDIQTIQGNRNEGELIVAEGTFKIYQDGQEPIITYFQNASDAKNLCVLSDAEVDYMPTIEVYRLNPNGTKTIVPLTSQSQSSGLISYTFTNQSDLQKGTYTLRKEVDPFKGTLDQTGTKENIDIAITPIKNIINKYVEKVNCPDDLETFNTKIINLIAEIAKQENANWSSYVSNGDVSQDFSDKYAELYTKHLADPDNTEPLYNLSITEQKAVEIKGVSYDMIKELEYVAPCGCSQKIELPFDFPVCEIPDEYDYESYIATYLTERKSYTSADISKIMYGWENGIFNEMVKHMLEDKYDVTNKAFDWVDNSPAPDATACPELDEVDKAVPYVDPYTTANGPNLYRQIEPQYTCENIIACIDAVLALMPTKKVNDPSYGDDELVLFDNENCMDRYSSCCIENGISEEAGKLQGSACYDLYVDCNDGVTTPADVMDESDQVDNNNNGNTHDDHFDDGISQADIGRLTKWYVGRKVKKMSKEMRKNEENQMKEFAGSDAEDIPANEQTSSSATKKVVLKVHFVDQFLSCTGYKFAKVITPFDPYPLNNDDLVTGENYYIDKSDDNSINKVFSSIKFENGTLTNGEDRDQLLLHKGIKRNNWISAQDAIGKNGYVAYKNWQTGRTDITDEQKEFLYKNFKYIPNPIYAFKYFMYPDVGLNTTLENHTCFDDANDCYDVDNNYINYTDELKDGRVYYSPDRIPCCPTENLSASEDLEHCVFETNYPNLEVFKQDLFDDQEQALLLENKSRFDENRTGKYRLKYFCGDNQKMCSYNHTHYGEAELLQFYTQIKYSVTNFRLGEDPDSYYQDVIDNAYAQLDNNNSQSCQQMITNTNWYKHDELGDALIDEELKDALYLNDPQSRYFINHIDDPGTSSDDDVRSFKPVGDLVNIDGIETSYISSIEILAGSLQSTCSDKCDERRPEFKRALMQALIEGCYVIGDCNSGNANVIPDSHIDQMVDALIQKCKTKCTISTYTCVYDGCRTYSAKKGVTGIDNKAFNLRFGVYATDRTFDNDGANSAESLAGALKIEDIDARIQAMYPTQSNPKLYKIHEDQQYSWYEWVQMNEAINWIPQVSLGSQCQNNIHNWGAPSTSHVTKETFLEESSKDESDLRTGHEPVNVNAQ